MFLLVLSGCSVLRSRQLKKMRGNAVVVDYDDADDDVAAAAGALMKFAYDTMRGVSARCCWVSVFSSCWWFAYYDFALRWRSHLRFGR